MSAFNSEHFQESLRNLQSFKVHVENFNQNSFMSCTLLSTDFAQAAISAYDEYEHDGWFITSIERVFDDDFFAHLSEEIIGCGTVDDAFVEIMSRVDWDESI